MPLVLFFDCLGLRPVINLAFYSFDRGFSFKRNCVLLCLESKTLNIAYQPQGRLVSSVGYQTVVREVEGSNPGRPTLRVLKLTEEKVLLLL